MVWIRSRTVQSAYAAIGTFRINVFSGQGICSVQSVFRAWETGVALCCQDTIGELLV